MKPGFEILCPAPALSADTLRLGRTRANASISPSSGYVRYQAAEPGRRGAKAGIFALANGLAREGVLSDGDFQWWAAANAWYEQAYPDPSSVDPRVYDRALHPQAQAWFKADADHLLARIPGYLALLNRYGVPWEEVRSSDPGQVLYEDAVQIVAEPYR